MLGHAFVIYRSPTPSSLLMSHCNQDLTVSGQHLVRCNYENEHCLVCLVKGHIVAINEPFNGPESTFSFAIGIKWNLFQWLFELELPHREYVYALRHTHLKIEHTFFLSRRVNLSEAEWNVHFDLIWKKGIHFQWLRLRRYRWMTLWAQFGYHEMQKNVVPHGNMWGFL